MHPSTIHRVPTTTAHTACTMLLSSSRTPLHLRSAIARTRRPHALQARTLWWWSRHGSEWATPDKGLEERMQRYEKIMKYRYSKALRRRRMWDLDDHTCRPGWGWRLPGRWMGSRWADYKNLSSGQPLQADVHDREKGDRKEPRPWDQWEEKWNKDYESFKKAVDKAINRDPYGTLFGRHLRSPPTANNSSWTSFSWIFEPKAESEAPKRTESQSEKVEKGADTSEKSHADNRAHFSVPPRPPTTVVKNQTSASETEYEYDPISMRKVLKTKNELPMTSSETKSTSEGKPFLSSLFSEHGVDIPVKTYKPHKVYGYGSTTTVKDSSSYNAESEKPRPSKKGFESSRLRELQNLKSITLGTNIDTTAEYGGKYQAEDESAATAKVDVPEPKNARIAEVEDNAPLFSGTTYQSRSEEILAKPKNDWLLKEGFRTFNQAMEAEPPNIPKANVIVNAENKGIQGKLESSLDRMQVPKGQASVAERNALKDTPEVNKIEDIDLLRASDVRAAARTARKTKQEAEQNKKEARQQLEQDYVSRRQDNSESSHFVANPVKDTTSKLTNTLSGNLWKHVREYPQGIVAKTMKSMGFVDQDDMERQEREFRLAKETSNASSKTRPAKPPAVPEEVCEAERESVARTAALKQATADAKKHESLKQQQGRELAAELRTEYENRYGLIDVHHRQQADTVPEAPKSESRAIPAEKEDRPMTPRPAEDEVLDHPAEAAAASRYFEGKFLENAPQKSSHPLQTATVKPGFVQDAFIEKHVVSFEPKLAKLVDEAKEVRHNLREVHLHIKAMRSKRPLTYWNAGATTEPLTTSPAASESSAETSSASPPPTYVFLAYNPTTNEVIASCISSRLMNQMPAAPKSMDLTEVLTKLKTPAKFVPHFDRLQKDGYELLRGGTDSLVFKKVRKDDTAAAASEVLPAVTPAQPAPEAARAPSAEKLNQIASEEASAQPESIFQPQKPSTPAKEAAEVLDEIPGDVNPAPGPAAPTAPPSTPYASQHRHGLRRAIRRQESVFSGQRVPSQEAKQDAAEVADGDVIPVAERAAYMRRLRPLRENLGEKKQPLARTDHITQALLDDKLAEEQAERELEQQREKEKEKEKEQTSRRPGFWARLGRGTRRVLLTGFAMAGFAYAVGAVAEGVGAGQDRRGKKVVMNANSSNGALGRGDGETRRYVGRPGIYSTESSRS